MARICIALIGLCLFSPVGAQSIVGWRTDGTSRYPDASVVTQWGEEKNVLWQTALPASSNATPVIVGERLFICAEPATLICVNAKTGQILWQADNSYDKVLTAEQRQPLEAESKAGSEQAAVKLKEVNEQIEQLRASAQPDERKMRQLIRQRQRLEGEAKAEGSIGLPRAHGTNGYSSPTPVSDGKHVFVTFGTGVAAAYDLEGKRLWATFIARPAHGWGHSASPTLAGGHLIVHLGSLRALNVTNGQEVWNTPAKENWGSPAAARIGGVDVIFTTDGQAVRATDGKVLATGLGTLEYATPVVQDGVVYYIESKATAFKLPASADEPFEPTRLWMAKVEGSRHYASPVIHEGLIYCISREEIYTVLDAKDGSIVHQQRDLLGNGSSTNSAYPSIILAGDRLIVSNESGSMSVLKTGRTHEVIASNRIEGFRSTPVCVGERMYIRAYSKLYCIGSEG